VTRAVGRALAAGLLLACGVDGAKDRSDRTGPEGQVAEARPEPPDAERPACDAAGEALGGTEWLPADARLAVVVDGDDPGLAAAVERVEAGASGRGLPIVAGLALGQLGLQLTLVRGLLARAGLRPRELALIHDKGGAVVWVWRARCDLRDLQAAMARAWGVRGRAVAGGEVAEAAAGSSFPHDVVFLAEDRVALVPAGQATATRRWLESPAPPPAIGGPPRPQPGAVLGQIPPAPIRGVMTGTSVLAGAAPDVVDAPPVRTLRATPEAFEIDGPGPGGP
jgi:hypothetical protein